MEQEQIEEIQQDELPQEFNQNEKKPEQKKRKKASLFTFKPEQVTDTKLGMLYLYNLCKEYPFRNDEIEELNRYMHVIEEWHYQIMPKYDFDYFTNRLQKFGGQNNIQTHLQFLRKAHKGLIPWSFITNQTQDQNDINIEQEIVENTKNNDQIVSDLANNIHDEVSAEIPVQINTQNNNSISQKKPIKLSLKKHNQSERKNLSVHFNDQVIQHTIEKRIISEQQQPIHQEQSIQQDQENNQQNSNTKNQEQNNQDDELSEEFLALVEAATKFRLEKKKNQQQ